MLSHLRDLMAHCGWADAVFFHAWARGDREDRELRERVSHSGGTQEMLLNSVRGEDVLPWDRIMRGEVKPPWVGQPLRAFEDLRSWTRSNHDRLKAEVEALDEAGLGRKVTIPWFPDPPCVISVGEALVQAAMHTQHHRGQNITRLRQTGGEPKNVDFIIWLWKGRPAAIWD